MSIAPICVAWVPGHFSNLPDYSAYSTWEELYEKKSGDRRAQRQWHTGFLFLQNRISVHEHKMSVADSLDLDKTPRSGKGVFIKVSHKTTP
ncbi:hypothetical protein XELAEV_18033088mg [Xenopus laevis]|uniref:Uncharacterized protein n=1 Tax=Xenopus laevis TaxID=8355 RepID=A0A974CIX0_XENLA|nr:hypothetical protein XELAEV_18033088mg [Xenopus laevis]